MRSRQRSWAGQEEGMGPQETQEEVVKEVMERWCGAESCP